MVVNHIKEIVHVHNDSKYHFVCLFYQLTSFYNLSDFKNDALNYIYRWFTIIAKIDNFQYLELNNIIRILSSSELNISSELEVFNASDFWLSCESFNRSKFAKELFLKTRFPLLSDHVTRSLLEQNRDSNNSFHKSKKCLVLIEEVLKNKEEFYRNKSTIYYSNRYCNNSMYDILFCGRFGKSTYKTNMNFHHFEAGSFKEVEKYTKTEKWTTYTAAVVKNMVFFLFFDENDKKLVFIKHSPYLKTWENFNFFYYRRMYANCMCSFVDSIYFIGGRFYDNIDDDNDDIRKNCILFDTNTKKWKKVTKMNDSRMFAACTVFEGRVVVSGGFHNMEGLRTVEAYDHIANEWSYMPSMINESCGHDIIAISNKLFAIGCGQNRTFCEVYDTISGRFVVLNMLPRLFGGTYCTSTSIGKKVMVFINRSKKVAIYDVDKNEWSAESFKVTKNTSDFHCLKIPSLKF